MAGKGSTSGGGHSVETAQLPKTLHDYVRDLSAGMNAGVDPLLLQRNQAAYLRNATVRGTFATHRPPYTKIALNFSDNSIQPGATQGLWQGATYFKSDDGVESLMASVAGRLFRFVIHGQSADVTERTNPSLFQTPTAAQCWLWQTERWTIFNDGASLPLFDDGNTIRRSNGSVNAQVGTTTGFTRVAVGNELTIPLSGPYTGPVGGTVTILGKKYTINSATATGTSAYTLTLKYLGLVPGSGIESTFAAGTAVKESFPNWFLTANPISLKKNQQVTINLDRSLPGAVGDQFTLNTAGGSSQGCVFQVNSKSGHDIVATMITAPNSTTTFNFAAGSLGIFQFSPTYQTLSTTSASFSVSTVGQTVTVQLASAYLGFISDLVRISNSVFEVMAYNIDTTQTYNADATNVNDAQTGTVAAATPLIFTSFELPAGRMGDYVRGRNWMSLPDGLSFVASDIVNSQSSGSANYNFRDSVLNMTENDLLLGGGAFRVPAQAGASIRAIRGRAILDASLGQGPVAIVTPKTVFSCAAPDDRTTWATTTNPILTESVKAGGGQAQDSTIVANSDLVFRSQDGIRSEILARRDFDTWGNVPISREVQPFLDQDDKTLLQFGSSIEFDNRKIDTLNPQQATLGVYHNKLVVLNYDPISSLRGKAPAVYDGIWDGLNVLTLVTGTFLGVERAFAFCLSSDLTTIELWEILPSATTTIQDDTGPIQWRIETAALNFYENDPRKRDFLRLLNGEIRVDMLNYANGQKITTPTSVLFETFYKPDQYPDWVPWHSWTETFDPLKDPGFRPELGLGEPTGRKWDTENARPLREFTTMQFAIQVTGHCRVINMRFKGCTIEDADFAPPA